MANPYEYLDDEEDHYVGRKKPRKHNNQRHRNKKRKKNKDKSSLVLTEKIQVIKSATKGGNALLVDGGGGGGMDSDEATVWVENGTRRDQDAVEAWEYGRNVSFIDDEDETAANKSIQMKKENWMKLTKMQPPPFQTDIHTSSDGFFCESPSECFIGPVHLSFAYYNSPSLSPLFQTTATRTL